MRLAAGAIAWAVLGLAAASLAAAPLDVEEVAAGLFVHRGLHEDIAADNQGAIANLAFVVGGTAVAVVDTGGSPQQGRALLAAVRAVTDRPVRWVISTHDHPDHVMGHAAFQAAPVGFAGHARLAEALATRGQGFLANMRILLGAGADGAVLVPPTLTVEPGATTALDLGGRRLLLQAWPTAHTASDLTVLDEATGTLIAGDLLFMERLPVIDGSLAGWLEVMQRLALVPARQVVPGHGPPLAPWPEALAPQRAYLAGLRQQVGAALDQGLTLQQAVEQVAMPGPEWQLRDGNHQRNVIAAYTELEWE